MARADWSKLSHEQRVQALARNTHAQILKDYFLPDKDEDAFRARIDQEKALWDVGNIDTKFKKRGKPPTKDVVLGAWRDLDRSEAILELIDNSIDAWNHRRKLYPKKTADELNIYVRVDTALGQLTYEDNAGGVAEDSLDHLIVPGYSATTPDSATIGSYKTGGKKAIFRLATAARISTRYWSPTGSSDDVFSIQLDEEWMNNVNEYSYSYTTAKKDSFDSGQTKYVLQLREEPVSAPWYESPDSHKAIRADIQRRYGLLLIRNPNIHIYFQDLHHQITPNEESFKFAGTHDNRVDIRPQRIAFTFDMEYLGKKYPVTAEITLGCRTTTGTSNNDNWGFDLYGNDRLFVEHDQDTFAEFVPGGAAKGAIRGIVNIRGPNIFIPWDTHKRHLNKDTELVRILTKHQAVKEFLGEWKKIYAEISKAGRGGIIKLLSNDLSPIVSKADKDLNIPHKSTVAIEVDRPSALPKGHRPKLVGTKRTSNKISVKLVFTPEQAAAIASSLGCSVTPPADFKAAIHAELLRKATGGKKKK